MQKEKESATIYERTWRKEIRRRIEVACTPSASGGWKKRGAQGVAVCENQVSYGHTDFAGHRKPDITGRAPQGRLSKAFISYQFNIRKRIEVVITGLTRNQLYLTVPWVRIPPLPPIEKVGKTAKFAGFFFFCGEKLFFDKVVAVGTINCT